MKKTLNLILAVLVAAVGFSILEARLTGTDPGTDAFCVGPNGAEACVDASGNVIPTTTADADLGTSSLVWNALHLTAGGLTDGAVTTADVAQNAITTSKLWLDLTSTGAACITTSKMLGTCSNAVQSDGTCSCS